MTYSRRNLLEEQQEACQQATKITAICEQFHITLDPIHWRQFGLLAPITVNSIEIASLLDLGKREKEDILHEVQLKLFEHAALATLPVPHDLKAVMWSPIEVVQPQAFLSLWVITLETDERIPVMELLREGRRVYEPYPFDGADGHQLAELFGPMNAGAYHLGATVTIKERDRQYTGTILYILSPGKAPVGRKPVSRGYHTISGTAPTNNVASRYLIDCRDGFPHIAYQSQIIPQ